MRLVKTFGCLFAALFIAACDCFVPVSPTGPNPGGDNTPPPSTNNPVVVSLSVQGATSLRVGESTPWEAVAQYDNGTQRIVTSSAAWASSSPSTAVVNGAGVVMGLAIGESTIQASYEGKSGSGVIAIVSSAVEPPTVTSLSIEGNTSIRIGESTPLQAVARLSDGTTQTVTALATWTSDAPSVATVAAGTVLGIASGQAPIRASYGGRNASATVTVSAASTPETPTVVSLSITGNTTVQVNQTTQLQAVANFSDGSSQNVTGSASWSSSATNIATVSSGLVTGHAAGTAPIQASYQGRVASAGVIVTSGSTPPPTVTSLSIQGNTAIQVGQTSQLQATAHLSDGSSQVVTGSAAWSSQAPGVATVSSAGLVTAHATGTAPIQASYQGQVATANVVVSAAAPTKTLTGIEVTAEVDLTQVLLNQPFSIRVYGVYSDGSKEDVTSVAAIRPDDPQIHHDTPGTLNVAMTLVDALLDPNHVVNVEYGGFTEAVNIVLKLPAVQALGLSSGDFTSINLGSQLPAVQGTFEGGATAALDSDFPGVTWEAQPAGPLGSVLGLLGVNLNQFLTTTNGQINSINNTLLNQVMGLVGPVLPVNLRASYDGVQSNVVQAGVKKP